MQLILIGDLGLIRVCKNCNEIIYKGDSYVYKGNKDFCNKGCYMDYYIDIIEKDMRSSINI